MSQPLSFIDPAQIRLKQLTVTYPTGTQEVYTFQGQDGQTMVTVTVNYVDSTKQQISSVVKS